MLAGVLAAGIVAAAAHADTRNGVTPLAPERGAEVPADAPLTFRVRARGGGRVFLHVCRRREPVVDGVICRRALIRELRRVPGSRRYRWTEPAYGLEPGRYFWQAYRIRCEGEDDDCRQEGPVRSLRVTG